MKLIKIARKLSKMLGLKAEKYKSPISFAVCKDATKDLKTDKLFQTENIQINSKKSKVDKKSAIEEDKKEKTADIEDFYALWNDKSKPSYRINLYYAEPEIHQQNNAVVSFKFQVLKEFANPVGVFIIFKTVFSSPL